MCSVLFIFFSSFNHTNFFPESTNKQPCAKKITKEDDEVVVYYRLIRLMVQERRH